MWSRLSLFVAVLFLVACSDKVLSEKTARSIADHRYLAWCSVMGCVPDRIPTPNITVRQKDTMYRYVEPQTKKIVIVIINRAGNISDTIVEN